MKPTPTPLTGVLLLGGAALLNAAGAEAVSPANVGSPKALIRTVESGVPGVQAPAAALKIRSARRAKEYVHVDLRTYRPRDAQDVMLVLELEGITPDEFLKIDVKDIYISAGEDRFPAAVAGGGLINGDTRIHVVASVSQTRLDLTLFVGTHAPLAFTAAKIVEDVVRAGSL